MNNAQWINDVNDTRWFKESLEVLKSDPSLSTEDIERIITDTIADYVIGTIGVIDLLEFTDTLKKSKAKLSPDLQYIAEDLSELHNYKSDKQFVHSILIDVLRKVDHTGSGLG